MKTMFFTPRISGARFGGRGAAVPVIKNQGDFEREVLKANGPVLVKFSTPACEWCRVVQPDVEALAKAHVGRVKVVEVLLDKAAEPDFVREIAQTYDINRRGVPTFSLIVNGQEQGELICTRDVVEALQATIESRLLFGV